MEPKTKANLIFAVLATYVIIQFLWWAYLLLSLNTDYYHLKQELHLAWGVDGQADLRGELTGRRYMIIGEGLIFLLLLIVGMVWTARYMKRDARRARLQHNFLLSVTHELKTPIAATQLYLQTLQKRKVEPDQQAELTSRALASNKRLEQLVEKLLLATQLENAGVQVSALKLEILPIVRNSIDTIKSLDEKQHTFQLSSQDSPSVMGDAVALETIILNLLENAVKYSPAGSDVMVYLSHDENRVQLVVESEGYISVEDQKQVFRKFFRSGNEETRSAKGTGVGLYLVKALTGLHNGKVNLEVSEGKVRFSVFLPRA